MHVSPSMSQVALRLLFACTFFSSILAEVTWTQFSNSFKLYPSTGPGGCDRNAPNGVAMKEYVLTSLDDAWAASKTVVDDLPKFSYNRDVRGLLFLLFGVTCTKTKEPNPNDGSDLKYNYISHIFKQVNQLKTNPVPDSIHGLGRFRCLEDYATYYRHMPGSDGQENMTAPLVAEFYNVTTSNGSYFPGLMFVNNAAITQNQDQNNGFYTANEKNPSGGDCGERDEERNEAFTLTGGNSLRAIFGITLCPDFFNQPTTSSLGSPNVTAGRHEIDRFMDTGGMVILHEMMHLVSLNCKKPCPALCERYIQTNLSHIDIRDQSVVYPPKGKSWKNRDFANWILDPTEISYGYTPVAYLGLAMPKLAMINAESYTVLGVYRQNPELDCLGKFQKDIIAKRKLPFQVSPRAVQKIRSGELDLKKDDVPTDIPDDSLSMYQSEIGGTGNLELRHSIGQTGEHPSRLEND